MTQSTRSLGARVCGAGRNATWLAKSVCGHAVMAARDRVTHGVAVNRAAEAIRPERLSLELSSSLDRVEVDWRVLQREPGTTLFQTWRWQKTWYDRVGVHEAVLPSIVTIRGEDGRPLALLPLMIVRRRGVREAHWLAEKFLDCGQPLCAQPLLRPDLWKGSDGLWHRVRRTIPADVVHLLNMPCLIGGAANPLVEALPVEAQEPNLTCDLTSAVDFDALQRRLRSAKTLKKDRRQQRRLAEFGEVAVRTATSRAVADTFVDALFAIRGLQLREIGADSLYDRRGYRDFLLDLWQDQDAELRIDLTALFVGDQIAAVHWGGVHGGRFYYLQPGSVRSDLGRYSPGLFLLKALIARSMGEGLSTFDFGLGDQSYKDAFATDSYTIWRHVAANSLAGRAHQAVAAAARAGRQTLARVRRT